MNPAKVLDFSELALMGLNAPSGHSGSTDTRPLFIGASAAF
jgi:hypothetical protein